MQYQQESGSLSEIKSDVVILGVFLEEDVAELIEKLTRSAEQSLKSFIGKIPDCLGRGLLGKVWSILQFANFR